MAVKLKVCTNREEWDKLVGTTPQGTIFHGWDFLHVMEKHSVKKFAGRELKARLYPMIAHNGNEPVGVYPLFVYELFSIRFLSSPPEHVESIYLGPVLVDSDKLKPSKKERNLIDLQKETDSFIDKNIRPAASNINVQSGVPDSRPFKWAGYAVEPRHSYQLSLSPGAEKLWEGLHTDLRKKINKTVGEGVTVGKGSVEDLKLIHGSLSRRRAEQGTSMTCSLEYLEEICKILGEQVDIRVARKDGVFLGGLVNLLYNGKAYSWVGSARSADVADTNELITWESIKNACIAGCQSYEIMGADSPNLYPFKTRYNGKLITYLSCRKYRPRFLKIAETAYKTLKGTTY